MINIEEKTKRLNELSEEMGNIYVEIFEDLGNKMAILEILKDLFKYKGNCEWLFHYLDNEDDKQLIKGWLNDK